MFTEATGLENIPVLATLHLGSGEFLMKWPAFLQTLQNKLGLEPLSTDLPPFSKLAPEFTMG